MCLTHYAGQNHQHGTDPPSNLLHPDTNYVKCQILAFILLLAPTTYTWIHKEHTSNLSPLFKLGFITFAVFFFGYIASTNETLNPP